MRRVFFALKDGSWTTALALGSGPSGPASSPAMSTAGCTTHAGVTPFLPTVGTSPMLPVQAVYARFGQQC